MGNHLPPRSVGKISVYPHNGRYRAEARVKLKDGTTRRVRKTADSQAEATRLVHLAAKDALSGTIDVKLSLAQLIVTSVQARHRLGEISAQTKERYLSDLNLLGPNQRSVAICDLSVPLLQTWIDNIVDSKSRQAARRVKILLTGAMSWGLRRGLVDANHAKAICLPRQRQRPVVEALDLDEIRQVIELVWRACLPNFNCGPSPSKIPAIATELIAGTGMRVGEVFALCWGDVDLENKCLTVRATLVEVGGQILRQPHPKTAAGNRVNFLSERLVELLSGLERSSPYVLPSRTGGPFRPANYRRTLRKALKDTEFEGVSPHTFRRSVGTILAQQLGVDAAADQLGHASATITRTYYIARGQAGPRQAANVLQVF